MVNVPGCEVNATDGYEMRTEEMRGSRRLLLPRDLNLGALQRNLGKQASHELQDIDSCDTRVLTLQIFSTDMTVC
tara:strand:+ start:34684 stop:34908 length:225 start_codon:yes stop_codon:yes gene_type:complete